MQSKNEGNTLNSLPFRLSTNPINQKSIVLRKSRLKIHYTDLRKMLPVDAMSYNNILMFYIIVFLA